LFSVLSRIVTITTIYDIGIYDIGMFYYLSSYTYYT